jgi:hypothetical protein
VSQLASREGRRKRSRSNAAAANATRLTIDFFLVTFHPVKAVRTPLVVTRPRVPFDPIAGSTAPALDEAPRS